MQKTNYCAVINYCCSNLSFTVAHEFTFIKIFISPYSIVSFHSTLLNSFEHFLQGRSSGHKLTQLLFILECLNFSLTLKGSFTSYRVLGLQIPRISLSFWNILVCCLLASKVSNERAAENLRITCDNSLFSRVSLSLPFVSLILICLSVDLFEFILCGVH